MFYRWYWLKKVNIQWSELLFNANCLEYKNTYLTDQNSDLLLTVDLLITLNNIITDSQNIGLRDINVKRGFDKIFMDKSLIEPALYQLVDEFNERKVKHNNFVIYFEIWYILFEMEMDEHAKFYLLIK